MLWDACATWRCWDGCLRNLIVRLFRWLTGMMWFVLPRLRIFSWKYLATLPRVQFTWNERDVTSLSVTLLTLCFPDSASWVYPTREIMWSVRYRENTSDLDKSLSSLPGGSGAAVRAVAQPYSKLWRCLDRLGIEYSKSVFVLFLPINAGPGCC